MLNDVKQKALVLVQENSSALLTIGGVVGTVATAVLTGRASYKASRIIKDMETDARVHHVVAEHEASKETGENSEKIIPPATPSTKDKLLKVWPLFVAPVTTGVTTIVSIVMANRMSAQKAAALAAAYGLAERNLSEYKEKVAAKLTGPKKEQIEAEIAQDRVNRTPGHDKLIIIEGSDVLCFDEPTGRYFKSTMEKIRRAQNATNTEILRHGGASASHFYDELELPPTTWSDEVGWGIGQQVELKISHTIIDEKPCITIDFKDLPTLNWSSSYS